MIRAEVGARLEETLEQINRLALEAVCENDDESAAPLFRCLRQLAEAIAVVAETTPRAALEAAVDRSVADDDWRRRADQLNEDIDRIGHLDWEFS